MQYSGDFSFLDNLNKGLAYYLQNFFTADGIPKYYNNAIYPIDIHAPAQLVLTLSRLKKFNEQINLINKVIGWTIENMQSKDGFFYYQKKKYFTSRVSYMRWSQSWMFFALTEYFKNDNQKKN
jgi:hypothetical protein